MTDRLTEIRERAAALLDGSFMPVWHDADLGYATLVEQVAREDIPYLLDVVRELQALAISYFRQIQMEKLRVERGERSER